MSNENRLDDFLRQKEEEFNIPYKEEYWEKASAFLDAQRGVATGRWTVAGIALLSSAVILSIALVGYFVFNSNSNRKAETIVSATVNSSTVKTTKSTSANNENNNATVTAGSAATSNNNMTGGAIANTKTATGENNANTTKANSNSNKSSVSAVASASAFTGKSNAQSTSKSTGNATNAVATNNARQTVNARGENSGNAVANSSAPNEVQNTDMSSANTLNPAYFNSHFESQIPEFENMTINDKTIAVLYGLSYKSEGSAAYKKAYELHSAIYPQLGVSLTGGMNVFESFKGSSTPPSYESSNPFVGAKATYQWNPEWLIQGQLNVLLRGGVNQEIPESNGGTLNSVRNLYYIQLPIMLGYQLSKKNMISAGLGINYLIADGIQAKDTSGTYHGTYKFENGNGFNKLDYFATVAYTYRLNRKFSFSLSADYGFTNVTNDNSDEGAKPNNHNISLGLAINYNLLLRKVGK